MERIKWILMLPYLLTNFEIQKHYQNEIRFNGVYLRDNHIPKEIKSFISPSLSITANIFRVHAHNSIMCGYFCIGFIDFVFKGKTLTEFTNLFSPNNFERNDDLILKYFLNNT